MPESYLHRYSKIVLSSWYRKYIRVGKTFKGMNGINLNIDWDYCKNSTPKGTFGVFQEWPVCMDKKSKKTIGLTLESWKEWLTENSFKVVSKTNLPNLKELKDLFKKLKVLHLFDVAIVDNTGLKCVLEVCHKNPCDDSKIEWLKLNNIPGYEFDANWIMSLVQSPFNLDIKRTLHSNTE